MKNQKTQKHSSLLKIDYNYWTASITIILTNLNKLMVTVNINNNYKTLDVWYIYHFIIYENITNIFMIFRFNKNKLSQIYKKCKYSITHLYAVTIKNIINMKDEHCSRYISFIQTEHWSLQYIFIYNLYISED